MKERHAKQQAMVADGQPRADHPGPAPQPEEPDHAALEHCQRALEDARRRHGPGFGRQWRCDVIYGPAVEDGATKPCPSCLIAFYDIATGTIPFASCMPSQRPGHIMEAFRQAATCNGPPQKLMMDHAPGFASQQVRRFVGLYGTTLAHCRCFRQSKLERWFYYVLPSLFDGPSMSIDEVNRRLLSLCDAGQAHGDQPVGGPGTTSRGEGGHDEKH